MNNLRIGFSLYGLIIVVLHALPNIVWALFPPTRHSASVGDIRTMILPPVAFCFQAAG